MSERGNGSTGLEIGLLSIYRIVEFFGAMPG